MLIIFGIALSRVYLGVHSIYDVLGGLGFGILILLVYKTSFNQNIINKWYSGIYRSYWLLLFIIIIFYVWVSYHKNFSPLAYISIGALIGYGCSLPFINQFQELKRINLMQIILGLAIIFFFYKILPIFPEVPYLFEISLIVKYFIIIFMISVIIPFLNQTYYRVLNDKK